MQNDQSSRHQSSLLWSLCSITIGVSLIPFLLFSGIFIQDIRPAGVYVLRHRQDKTLYWGTGWDLYEIMREQMEAITLQKHPHPPLNHVEDLKLVDFIVIKEASLSDSFQLLAFEEELDQQLKIEVLHYRSIYVKRLVQLYRVSRLR